MDYLFNAFGHIKSIRAWAKSNNAKFSICMETFKLRISAAGKSCELIPRFIIKTGNKLAYTHAYLESGFNFVGWLPYELKRWPLASDKLVFKDFCRQHGLRAPRYSSPNEAPAEMENFIVKQRQGSFGQFMKGPFRASDTPMDQVAIAADEYFDEYIFGRSTKIWYWGAQATAMESLDPPFIIADGRHTLKEIADARRGSFDKSYALDSSAAMLAWQGWNAASTPPKDERIYLDYKHGTAYDKPTLQMRNDLPAQSDAVKAELRRIGEILIAAVPEPIRQACMFTLDAVMDDQDRLWLLEMNSHPMVHASVYPAMLDEMFRQDGDSKALTSPPSPSAQ